ncbi:ImmA/IrrE family metallo-endopeptidase [Methylobacter sp. Wu8]|uniref:ImmA/IrrE family metallo-endopeptidase n=1 Tax=Methylobacter sp. Wu8 TaxID=3118457 RepID=UPI002F313BE1
MTVTNPQMKRLYSKLQTVGYNPKYIKSLLPDWWDNEIAETPAGLQQASLILGQTFGVRAETLWTESAEPALKLPQGIRFKHRENIADDDLNVACAVARSLASIVLKAFPAKPQSGFYLDASELRKQLLVGKKWITFEDVLTYCLDDGIPVIHLHHLPKKAKKMEGLAFEQSGRPVIVLTQNHPHGYALFDLAHELGHITLGHVTAEHSIVDQKIDAEADDEDERAANRFALELLTGDPECKIVPTGRNLNGDELATSALHYGEKNKIDPLHIVLNYAYSKNHWGAANVAINKIAKNALTDQEILRAALLQSLELDDLNEDDYTLLQTHLQGKVD